jgi:hypothetical protein
VLAHSTVGITRYFDDEEKKTAPPGVLGIRGTGWFLAPLSLVTVKHVVAAMNLSDQNWKKIEIRSGENKEPIAARIQRFAGSHAEKIVVLELQTAFSGAHGFPLRIEPLVAEEPVVSLAYPGDRLRIRVVASCDTAKTTILPAQRCLRCMMEATASCSITAPPEHPYSTALAEW